LFPRRADSIDHDLGAEEDERGDAPLDECDAVADRHLFGAAALDKGKGDHRADDGRRDVGFA
jgi:hypothetical protein